jgi:hypothetical protein
MNLEDQIKETLMKHAADVRPDAGSWDGVETKVRRAHYARVAFVSTLTVALIAAAAIVLPRLGSETPKSSFTGTTPSASSEVSPTTTPTPVGIDTSGWRPRVGTQADFQLLLPPDWKGGWFEGYWDFEPKGLPGLPGGGDTFAIEVNLESGDYRNVAPKGAEATRIGERSALAWSPSEGHSSFAVQWTDCPAGADCVSGSERTLLVNMSGSTTALGQKYGAVGKEIVQTVRVYDGSAPAHGTAVGIPDDPYRRTLITFLDARVEGIGAEDLMCCSAPDFYASDGLYGLGRDSVVSFTVHSVSEAASAATSTYEVTLRYENDRSRTESISVVYESGKASSTAVPKIGDAKLS